MLIALDGRPHQVVPSTAPSAGPNALSRPLRVVVIASMTAHTGNAITAARIMKLLPGALVSAVDIHTVSSRAVLATHLVAGGSGTGGSGTGGSGTPAAGLVLGVHAYRSGKLLLGCGVPYIIVLGGTDVNIDLHERAKGEVIRRVIAEAAAVVAFNEELKTALLALIPEARTKVFLIPQAVELAPPELVDETEDDAARRRERLRAALDVTTDEQRRRERLRAALDVTTDEQLLLLPAGVRPVKDVLWAVEAISQWHASDPRICLRIVGPVLDAKYAQTVEATLAALAAAPATARAVRYVGALPRAQLHEAMRMAAVVLNTSESEGQCNSLLEAMLAGTPVVARANPGNTSLLVAPGTVHQRYGLLGTTPEELVSQAQRLLADGARDGALAARLTHAAKAKVGVVNCLLIASLIRWSASLIRCKLRIRSRLRRSGTRQRHSTRSRTPALRRATRPT